MLNKAVYSLVYGVLLFFAMVGVQQVFGERDVHLTNFPQVEDSAIYMAAGTFIALSLIYRGRWIGNLIHAVVYAAIVFVALVVLEQVFGHHEYYFTRFHTAEDFAKFAALGMFLTLLMYGNVRVKLAADDGKPGSGSNKLANQRPPVGSGSAARKANDD